MSSSDTVRRRYAVRALLVDPEQRLLLIGFRFPGRDHTIWLAPGGGLETGEEALPALSREVFEETGQDIGDAQGPVWRRRHRFEMAGEWLDQSEIFYLVRVPHFSPSHRHNPSELERESFQSFRWWTLEELKSTSELLVPARIGQELECLLDTGLPEQPRDVGI